MRHLDLPPLWLMLFAALVWGQAVIWPLDFGGWAKVVGAGLIAAGLGLSMAALWQFRRHRTTVIPGQMPTALVRSGIFAYSRNPIYLSDLVLLAGLSLWWCSPLGLILVPLFKHLLTVRFIEPEERRMQQGFGSEFMEYTTHTRRWC